MLSRHQVLSAIRDYEYRIQSPEWLADVLLAMQANQPPVPVAAIDLVSLSDFLRVLSVNSSAKLHWCIESDGSSALVAGHAPLGYGAQSYGELCQVTDWLAALPVKCRKIDEW